jgi:cholesterol transport system auxiliary component
MNMAKSTIFQRVMVPGLLALSLGACVSFGAKAPPSMLVLTSTSSVTSGTIRSAAANEALVVLMPQSPRKLETNRLPVQIDDSSIAYLKDAVWADKPARLMQLLLMETIASKSGRLVLNEVDTGGKGQQFLSGSLLEFGVDAAAMEAVVVYDAVKLVRGQVVEKRRFEAKKSVTEMEAAPVGAALNDAANDVAGQIADWIG